VARRCSNSLTLAGARSVDGDQNGMANRASESMSRPKRGRGRILLESMRQAGRMVLLLKPALAARRRESLPEALR
jgi:hypothetical protein